MASLVIVLVHGGHAPANLLTLACSLLALVVALNDPAAGPDAPTQSRRLPRDLPLKSAPQGLPPLPQMLDALRQSLNAPPRPAGQPPTRDQAVERILRHALAQWPEITLDTLDNLSLHRVQTLYTLLILLRGTPGEAGRLAQMFRDPATVLALRDDVDASAELYAEWADNQRLLQATHWLWSTQQHRHASAQPTLSATLQSLGPADPDLWHRVVLHHDLTDPRQRRAALWCVNQMACDRATVATYLSRVALEGHLLRCLDDGLTDELAAVREIVARWNAGLYDTARIALLPAGVLIPSGPAVAEVFAQLAVFTGEDWPLPAGAFTRYDGRPARPRDNWDLTSGRMLTPPRAQDYHGDAALPREVCSG